MLCGYKPAVARLHDEYEASLSYSEFVNKDESILLFLAEGPKDIASATGAAVDKIAKKHGARTIGKKPLEVWLVHRNDLCEKLDDSAHLRSGVIWDTCEIAANWSEVGDIYCSVKERMLKEIDGLTEFSGHSSHSYMQGTNIYFIYSFKASDDFDENREQYYKILGIIVEETLKFGGTIAHHHGIGKYRTRWIDKEHGSAYCVLETLKKAFDPNGIMNKGTLFQG
jgi:FAD/FMN-containing dehydrogenase